ncbi:MAG: hypothetical protein JRI59_00270 [Deltaproteobacteria bacterium]|nr:hypothetical protein [Deltaproteobacteria bacterium]
MNILVTYYSETGNTEKVARAIFAQIQQPEKEISPLAEVAEVGRYDIIFCGFPIKSHSVPGKTAAFIKGLPGGKKVAFFATHGSYRGGALAVQAFHHALSLAPHLKILGTFGCRGKVPPQVLEELRDNAEHRAWVEEAQTAGNHPNEEDLQDAGRWARTMMDKALLLP